MSKETRGILEEQRKLEFHKLAVKCKKFLEAHDIETVTDTTAGHLAIFIQQELDALIAEKVAEARLDEAEKYTMAYKRGGAVGLQIHTMSRPAELKALTPPAEQAEKSQRTKLYKEMEGDGDGKAV